HRAPQPGRAGLGSGRPQHGPQHQRRPHPVGAGAQAAAAPDRETAMNELLPPSADADARLAEVLDHYLACLESGAAPSRDELLARHPDLADDLDACLASLGFIRRAAAKPADSDGPSTIDTSGAPAGVAGD